MNELFFIALKPDEPHPTEPSVRLQLAIDHLEKAYALKCVALETVGPMALPEGAAAEID